ncbi:ABC transporter substrate-binding protein [Sphingomonas jaspsi]|uniref:ABC transporter substrate-binding protein n=1 Tax=Sphingomonas jaspsi TaxID=392409 RepID=UPI0004B4B395|nr:ABC transporter substrate-binding protein [Sphingomonas jaspsi]
MATFVLPRWRALSLLLATMVAGCSGNGDELAKVGVIGDQPALVETVEAPLTVGEALVRSNMAQGLVRFDARGQVVPGLAERWNVSDDGLSYIFRLQTGEWPDGRKLKAQEVAKILSRQLREASRNPLKDTLGAVKDVVAMTDRVIEIRLGAPRPNLLQLLAQPELGLVRASVGTGPFFPIRRDASPDYDPAKSLLIEHRIRIPDAKDVREQALITGAPAFSLISQFNDGKLDVVIGGTFDDLPLLQRANSPRGSIRYDPVAGLFGLLPNSRSTLMRDRELRRLVARAIDRQAIVAMMNVPGLQPRATILQPGLEGVRDVVQPDWVGQPVGQRRAQLIAEANRMFGSVERPVVRIEMPQGPGGEAVIRQIARDLEPLGLKVGRAATPATADLLWIDEVAPSSSPAWFLRRFRCAVTSVCLEDVETVLAAARATPVARDRAALFQAVATQMDEAQLFIPVAAPVRWSLVRSGIDGFIENPFGRHTLVGLKNRRAREDE